MDTVDVSLGPIVKPGFGKTAMCVPGMHTAAKTPEVSYSRLTALFSPNRARNLNTNDVVSEALDFIVRHDVIKEMDIQRI